MKKVLKILGIIFLGIVVIIGLIGGWTYWKSTEYKETAVPYIKENVPRLSSWQPEVAKSLLAPNVLKTIKDEDLNKLMQWFSKLGKLESIEEPQFNNVTTSATVDNGKQTIVTYTIPAHYTNGDATITIRLLEVGEGFKLYQFNLQSMAFIN